MGELTEEELFEEFRFLVENLSISERVTIQDVDRLEQALRQAREEIAKLKCES